MKSLLIGASAVLLSIASSAHAQQITFVDYRHSLSTTTTSQVRCEANPAESAAEVRFEQTYSEPKGLRFAVNSVVFSKKPVSKEQLAQINKKVNGRSITGVSAQCRGQSVRLIFDLYDRTPGKPKTDAFIVIREDNGSIQIL